MSDFEMRPGVPRVGSPIPPQYHEALSKHTTLSVHHGQGIPNQIRRPGQQEGHLLDESPQEEDDPFLERSVSNAAPAGAQAPVPHRTRVLGNLSGANVVPLSLLRRWPATVECPACREITHTSARVKTGHGTHWIATVFFFTTGVGVIVPYITNFAKNVSHHCFRCGKKLATHHFGSGTETHLV